MRKYQDHLIRSTSRQLTDWLEDTESIPTEDIYRFLHSLKGTAATIGLDQLSAAANRCLEIYANEQRLQWSPNQVRLLLFEIITITYNYHPDTYDDQVFDDAAEPQLSPDGTLILILDDDLTLLMVLKEKLEQQGWTVLATPDPGRAIQLLHEMQPDCFITDLHNSGTTGFEVINVLRDRIKKQLMPTIMISADSTRSTRLQAYRMGADDFLAKPLDMEEFIVRIERQLERKKLIDQVMFIDELTGAYNRKFLAAAYPRLISELARTGTTFALAVVDLDRFKRVNDQYGHLIGDQVLAGLSAFIRNRMKDSDLFIRVGGEEFVMLMPETTAQGAEQALRRMLDEFSKYPFDSDQGPFKLTFSAGITEVKEESTSMETALEQADFAMYAAKKNGRARIECFSKTEPPLQKTMKVAILDDDAILRTLLTEYVRNCFGSGVNIDIRSFRDGESFFADSWYRGEESYLILLDGMMPRMDGLEVLQRLRSLPDTDRYLIVMLTGRKGEQDVIKALQLGADDYMTKPFSMNVLEARIKRLMERLK